MKISAAVTGGAGGPFSIEEVELDEPRSDEVLVRLVAAGICHTDLFFSSFWPAESGPIVLGHEGAGVVEAVGDDVTSVGPGDHVLMSFHSCQACPQCEDGHAAYCREFRALNFAGTRTDGSTTLRHGEEPVHGSFFGQSSFATHALAYEANVVRVDSDRDLSVLAPLGCGIQTGAGVILNVLQPAAGSAVAVFGAGGVGLAAVMAAKSLGVETIIAIDPIESRRDTAIEVGATAAIDPTDQDVVSAIRELTGEGPTHAFDTTGIEEVIKEAVAALAPRGVLAVVAVGPQEMAVNIPDLIVGGKSIRGVTEGDAVPQGFLPRLIEMYDSGQLPLEKIIETYPFKDIDQAIAASADGSAIKPVLVF